LSDEANGAFGPKKLYDDDALDDMDSIPDEAPHRAVDLVLRDFARDEAEKCNARIGIMMPCLIYGVGSGPFNRLSIQVPTLIKRSIKEKKPVVYGKGLAVWSNVHVEDLATAYLMVAVGQRKESSETLADWSRLAGCFTTRQDHRRRDKPILQCR
jgi:hypothetical protein